MKIAVIGGGASGVFFAIRCKELHPDFDITIFERNDKLLKKIYATGNGKCNFANAGNYEGKYNSDYVNSYLEDFSYEDINRYFESIGIKSKRIGDLLYPYSESAETVAAKLLKQVAKLKINVKLSEKVISYDKELKTDKGTYEFDRIVFAVGGKSSPIFGSDGNLIDEFKKHNYDLTYFSPSLCPIKVKENVKKIEGVRHKILCTITQKEKVVHKEEGEILFKKDGLSGIVIMNAAFIINTLKSHDKIKLHIDFVPEIKDVDNDYYSYVNNKLADYLINNRLDIKDTVFTYKSMYDYDNSHATSGGIPIKQINKNLSSKIERNVYFIGEVLDIDGACGGWNLMWAFSSANYVAKNIE